jgi:hypothetical protein
MRGWCRVPAAAGLPRRRREIARRGGDGFPGATTAVLQCDDLPDKPTA